MVYHYSIVVTGPIKINILLGVKPRHILVIYMDVFNWYITSNQQGEVLIQNLSRIVS